MRTSMGLKRKQPGDMPAQPTPQTVNIISDVVVSAAVAQPQGSGAVVNGCGGSQQTVNLGPSHHPPTPPVLHISERDFEPLNLEVMGILEELERTTKSPKLDMQPSGSQITSGSEAGVSNLGNNDGVDHGSQYSIPDVPPLLSPLPNDDDDFIVPKINQPSSSSLSKRLEPKTHTGGKGIRLKLPPSRKTTSDKKRGSKKSTSLLRDVLERRHGKNGSRVEAPKSDDYDSDFECFSQTEERDALKETARIYKHAKEVCIREQQLIDETAVEIQKTKEKLARLEEKMNCHRRILDNAKKKLRAVENIFGR